MEEFDKLDGYECEMILVNDFSRDHTYEAICRATKKYPSVHGINLGKNCGQHAAIIAGMQYVNGEYVIGMDDDLQTHPSQIPEFIQKAEEGYDVVFGDPPKKKFGFWKNFVSSVSTFFLNLLVELPKDIRMNNYWLARRYVVDEVKKYQGCDPFIQLLFFRTTDNMANVPIEHFAREVGTSNYTFRKGLRHFLTFIDYSIIPLRIASLLGTLSSLTGCISGVIVIFHKLLRPGVAVGWSSLMCVILILFGIVFFILGIIGEYVGKTIMTVNQTPLYIVRETTDDSNESQKKRI